MREQGDGGDEEVLAESASRGDKDSFVVLTTLHSRRAILAARAILANQHDAEDAFQEACLTAYKRLANLKDHRAFGPWFLRITVNKALDIRKARRHAVELSDDTHGVAGSMHDVDLAIDVQTALSQLPKRLRKIVELRQSGLSSKEIGKIVERPPGTVRRQLADAYKTLHQLLRSGS